MFLFYANKLVHGTWNKSSYDVLCFVSCVQQIFCIIKIIIR